MKDRLDGLRCLPSVLSDLRDALRALRHAPIQSLTIFFCLTLGSTLTVLMFGVVNAIIAGDLPGIRDRGRLMLARSPRCQAVRASSTTNCSWPMSGS